MNLFDYVETHSVVIDQGGDRVVDMYFFKVTMARDDQLDVQEFIRLTNEHEGEYANCNPLDGNEHNYIELGAWIGNQTIALQYMALGQMLGLWKVMQPKLILNINEPENLEIANQMAGMGMISIIPQLNKSTL